MVHLHVTYNAFRSSINNNAIVYGMRALLKVVCFEKLFGIDFKHGGVDKHKSTKNFSDRQIPKITFYTFQSNSTQHITFRTS